MPFKDPAPIIPEEVTSEVEVISDDEVVVVNEFEGSYRQSCKQSFADQIQSIADYFNYLAAPMAEWPEDVMQVDLAVSFSQKIPVTFLLFLLVLYFDETI